MQAEHRTHLFSAAQLELTQTAPLFDPAKHILDAAAGIYRFGGPIGSLQRRCLGLPPPP